MCCWRISSADSRAQTSHAWLNAYRADAARLIKAAQADDFAYRRLTELTDTFGARLSGSDNLKRAIDWAVETMKADGLENVRTEPVMVPHWVRGRESAEIIEPPQHTIAMLGLGGSVGTPRGGIEADVITVATFDDLQARRAEARGKIVLLQRRLHELFGYGDLSGPTAPGSPRSTERWRCSFAPSVRPACGRRTPDPCSTCRGSRAIPAAAIAAEDANRIARLTARGRRVRVRLEHGGAHRARHRVGQRRRRDPRPRAA